MNDSPLVLKGCMTVITLSLILYYCWQETTSQVRWKVDGGGTMLLGSIVVVIPLLLVIAGDVETNPGPGGNILFGSGGWWN